MRGWRGLRRQEGARLPCRRSGPGGLAAAESVGTHIALRTAQGAARLARTCARRDRVPAERRVQAPQHAPGRLGGRHRGAPEARAARARRRRFDRGPTRLDAGHAAQAQRRAGRDHASHQHLPQRRPGLLRRLQRRDREAAWPDGDRIAEEITRAVEAAEKANEAMGSVRASSEDVARAIRELSETSEQIGQIVQTITGIAEQTNLLARRPRRTCPQHHSDRHRAAR